MIAMLAAALIAASGQTAPVEGAVREARTFLEAFMRNPQEAEGMVSSDALIAVHDIGGTYAEFLSGLDGKKLLPAGCVVTSLTEKPTPPAAEMRGYPGPAFKTPGRFAVVEGSYDCPTPDSKPRSTDVVIYLKDGRVVLFGVEPRRSAG